MRLAQTVISQIPFVVALRGSSFIHGAFTSLSLI